MTIERYANTSKGTFEINKIPFKDFGYSILTTCPYKGCWKNMALKIDFEADSYVCKNCKKSGVANELLREMFKDRPVVLVYPFDRSHYDYL